MSYRSVLVPLDDDELVEEEVGLEADSTSGRVDVVVGDPSVVSDGGDVVVTGTRTEGTNSVGGAGSGRTVR